MRFGHVPAPDEALLISGSKHKDGLQQFRIVTGHHAVNAFTKSVGGRGRGCS
jgi:hypothetical protein